MAKRRKLQRHATEDTSKPHAGATKGVDQKKRRRHRQKQQEQAIIPFGPQDKILLIGEADLSFAASIIDHHGCVNVTATVLEKDHAELLAKYPSVDGNIAVVLGADDDMNEGANTEVSADDTLDEQDKPPSEDDEAEVPPRRASRRNNKLIYNVNATKLPKSLTRPPHDHVIFNFPHVGGKSTDVNRQVRYNQEMLVAFFQSALRALAPGGSIVVTLFEGEPYTLWNIRDLARHAGLQVERSFAFRSDAYPGYKHARTLGVVTNKKGEVGGGWKGEHRASRSYVFRRKGEVSEVKPKKKRGRDDDSSDDDG